MSEGDLKELLKQGVFGNEKIMSLELCENVP